jgi:hypothetical protein
MRTAIEGILLVNPMIKIWLEETKSAYAHHVGVRGDAMDICQAYIR